MIIDLTKRLNTAREDDCGNDLLCREAVREIATLEADVARLTRERDEARDRALVEVQEIAAERAAKIQREIKPQAESRKPSAAYRIRRSQADAWQSITDRVKSLRSRPSPAPGEAVREAAKVLASHTPNPVFDILKPALMGEYAVRLPDFAEDGNEYTRSVNIPWTLQKDMIRAAIAALASESQHRASQDGE